MSLHISLAGTACGFPWNANHSYICRLNQPVDDLKERETGNSWHPIKASLYPIPLHPLPVSSTGRHTTQGSGYDPTLLPSGAELEAPKCMCYPVKVKLHVGMDYF